jgi:hypothetical protein
MENIWPQHKGGLHISHNQHHGYYEKVEEAIGGEDCTYPRDDFPDDDEIKKCIETDSVWTIQWYPETPIGFFRVSAATLSRALEFALEES